MKIGIMTLWGTEHNYGAILQCYALQEYLRRKEHTPYLIRYKGKVKGISLNKITPIKLIKYMKKKVFVCKKNKVKDQPRFFSDFMDKYIQQTNRDYLSWNELKVDPPDADIYIVGSDQVWNFYETPLKFCKDHIHAFFLDFGSSKVRRVSYAASWDKKYVTDEHLAEIKMLIQKFQYISVREKSGLELCRKCGISKSEWVVDPTLLLNVEDYRQLYQETNTIIRKIKEKYILVYIVLSRANTFDIAAIYKYARDKNLRVVYVTEDKTMDSYEKYYPTIQEWLYLVDNAEYVVTNSFHGTVFSLIFNKQFCTIPLVGYAESTNTRIESLYEIFQISNRFIKNYDFSILDKEYHSNFVMNKNHFDDVIGENSENDD